MSRNLVTGGLSAAAIKPASRDSPAPHLVAQIRERAAELSGQPADTLISHVNQVRARLTGGEPIDCAELLASGLALSVESLQRTHGIRLYDVQLHAAVELARGRIAQMQTGEGKTFVAVTVAMYLGLAGRGVHVATPNVYLAERDQQLAAPVAETLTMTAGLLPERVDASQKRPVYDCDITYATASEYGFDYLRDQLTLRNERQAELGSRLLRTLSQSGPARRQTMQRGLVFGVVDEADSVLIDDAGSPLVLSLSQDRMAPDEAVHHAARAFVDCLECERHFRLEPASRQALLTEAGLHRCYEDDVQIPSGDLLRPWTQYVEQALRARYLFRRNAHYVIVDEEVRIVDESTGRIFEDRSWQDGLHQAIEAREGIPVTAEKEAAAQITRQRFFRLYHCLSGMTGTAVGCEAEFAKVYQKQVAEIPLRVPSQRQLLTPRFFSSADAKRQAIVRSVVKLATSHRPVLIGTRSIDDSQVLSDLLAQQGMSHQLLNGLQSAEEAELVAQAGHAGAVTIATNLAGRGTDIALGPGVRQAGGLHVIVAECQPSGRMDRQLIGRCARQGDPGSAQIFVSADDALLQHHAEWLASAIRREADSDSGEAATDFSSYLKRTQLTAERRQFLSRCHLLQQDTARDSLFGW